MPTIYKIIQTKTIHSEIVDNAFGFIKSVQVEIGCNGEKHAMQLIEVFCDADDDNVTHANFLYEMEMGKCNCRMSQIDHGGFILKKDLIEEKKALKLSGKMKEINLDGE